MHQDSVRENTLCFYESLVLDRQIVNFNTSAIGVLLSDPTLPRYVNCGLLPNLTKTKWLDQLVHVYINTYDPEFQSLLLRKVLPLITRDFSRTEMPMGSDEECFLISLLKTMTVETKRTLLVKYLATSSLVFMLSKDDIQDSMATMLVQCTNQENLKYMDEFGWTAIMFAAIRGFSDTIKAILKNENIDFLGNSGCVFIQAINQKETTLYSFESEASFISRNKRLQFDQKYVCNDSRYKKNRNDGYDGCDGKKERIYYMYLNQSQICNLMEIRLELEQAARRHHQKLIPVVVDLLMSLCSMMERSIGDIIVRYLPINRILEF